MKHALSIFLVLLVIITLNCMPDDDRPPDVLDSINRTGWTYTQPDGNSTLAFGSSNVCTITQPIYNGEWTSSIIIDGTFVVIEGTFEYNQPNVSIKFTGECTNEEFLFSSCNVSGSMSGNILTISSGGKEFEFKFGIK